MKKFCVLILSFLISLPVWAEVEVEVDLGILLNKITLQLQAERWVTTKTAVVHVAVNATVTDQGIGNIQADVLNKLKQLSDKGEWHVISFNRSLDQSGLENIRITAQARLPQGDLSGLRTKAKAISKPGETYAIGNVQFIPSEDEIRQANAALRNDLYLQAKAEIEVLNKIHPEQKYYLYSMDFVSPPSITPMSVASSMAMEKATFDAPAVSVGNKAHLQATVIIASMPEGVAKQLSK